LGDVTLNILIVEDDIDTRDNLRDILELDGHGIEEAATAAGALDRKDWSAYSAILLDRKLPDGTAFDLLPQLKRLAPAANVIIMTGYADVSGAIEALRLGADDYLLKPIDPTDLRARLSRIAEHRRLEEAHRESDRFARSVLDSLGAHIAVLDHSGTILAVNQAWRDFAATNEAGGANVAEGADYLQTCARAMGEDSDTARAFASGIRDVLANQRRSFELEYPCHAPDRRRWFLGRVTPFQGDGSRRVVVAHVDITERKLSEERALQAERLAAIGEMVTGLAHESRNALQRGHACLEMLALEVPDRPRARDLVVRLQKAQDDLARLYEDVRDYAAPIQLRLRACNLVEVWQSAWMDLGAVREGRVTVLREVIEVEDSRVLIDPFRMGQVFRNLLENALAACHDPVEIEIRCVPDDLNGQPAMKIFVRDNGPGFTPEQGQRVFEAFYTTKTKGTGLGLAICRRIIEAHKGRIILGDRPGRGAEFILIFPRGNP